MLPETAVKLQFNHHVSRESMVSFEEWSKLWQVDVFAGRGSAFYVNFYEECLLCLFCLDVRAKDMMKPVLNVSIDFR